jgi:hypothetical protein
MWRFDCVLLKADTHPVSETALLRLQYQLSFYDVEEQLKVF